MTALLRLVARRRQEPVDHQEPRLRGAVGSVREFGKEVLCKFQSGDALASIDKRHQSSEEVLGRFLWTASTSRVLFQFVTTFLQTETKIRPFDTGARQSGAKIALQIAWEGLRRHVPRHSRRRRPTQRDSVQTAGFTVVITGWLTRGNDPASGNPKTGGCEQCG